MFPRVLLFISALCLSLSAHAVRVKDLGQFDGIRSNSLIGYGLVVGLDGTGDQTTQTPFAAQSLQSMLSQMGVGMAQGTSMQTKNMAAVMITAELPAFANPGDAIDITVSSIGNAKSLKGGTLLLSSLKGPDGSVFALAQGNIAMGANGKTPQQQNAGRIPQGGRVERAAPMPSGGANGREIAWNLYVPNYSAAQLIEQTINAKFPSLVKAVSARRIVFNVEPNAIGLPLVELAAKVENLAIDVPISVAKVVINARTGSIVMGANVEIGECAISHGSLTISVGGKEGGGAASQQIAHVKGSATLADVVKMLGNLGVSPSDLIAILQAMREAGALQAELEVI